MTPPDVPADVMAAIEAYGLAMYRAGKHGPSHGAPDERVAALAAIAKALLAARGEEMDQCCQLIGNYWNGNGLNLADCVRRARKEARDDRC